MDTDKGRAKRAELLAAIGMVAIAVGLFLALLNMLDTAALASFRWIFAGGAVIFLVARAMGVNAVPGESVKIKRLRRIEFWSAVCFGVAAFFWFYNESRMGPYAGALMVLRDTILFSLAGAVLQLIAAWMIYFRSKKENQSGKG